MESRPAEAAGPVGVSPIDAAVADAGSSGLRVFIDGPDAIASVAGDAGTRVAGQVAGARGPV